MQQELPPVRADDVRRDHGEKSRDQQIDARSPHLDPHVRKVRVPQEPCEKGNRQN
jgi:hypothetical protein